MIEGIVAWAGAKTLAFAGGSIFGAILIFGKKYVAKLIGKFGSAKIKQGIENLDEIDDPMKKKIYKDWVLATVKLVEFEVPDKGMGRVKFQKVSDKLCLFLPFLKGQEDRIRDLIETAVEAMDQELKGAVDILKQ